MNFFWGFLENQAYVIAVSVPPITPEATDKPQPNLEEFQNQIKLL